MRAHLILVFIVTLLVSCQEETPLRVRDHSGAQNGASALVEKNKKAVLLEQRDIENYVRRQGLKTVQTGSGLNYQLIVDAQGTNAESGQEVLVEHEVQLLNGKVCYSSKDSGPESFVVEMDHVESGLHEGIQYMSPGDSAVLIIPSHLAHGLVGDMEKIPMRSTIVYHIKLLAVR
jgi:FKBP-type peptidyl-prolyl cis-trans isomerase